MAIDIEAFKAQMKQDGAWVIAEAPDVIKSRVRLMNPSEAVYAQAITRYETPQKYTLKDGIITLVQLSDQTWGGITAYPEKAIRFYPADDALIVTRKFELGTPILEARTFQIQDGVDAVMLSKSKAVKVPHYEMLDLFWQALVLSGHVTQKELDYYRQVLIWDDLPRARVVAA